MLTLSILPNPVHESAAVVGDVELQLLRVTKVTLLSHATSQKRGSSFTLKRMLFSRTCNIVKPVLLSNPS